MSDRFFTPDSLGPGEYVLSGAEAHHLTSVRRFELGDHVVLFNGDGNDYPAEIIAVSKKTVALNVGVPQLTNRELNFPLVLASALPKGDRADFLIEKLTELGVTRFIPLVTTRSVVRPKESAVEKFERAVIEASKQCGRNRLMAVDSPRDWNSLLALTDLPASRCVLHVGEERASQLQPLSGVVVAVGPEGGFTAQEVESAVAAGWQTVSFGLRVLRTETAAIAAAAILGARGNISVSENS